MMPFETLSNTDGQHGLDVCQAADTLVPLKSLRLPFREDLFKHAALQTVCAGEVIFEEGSFDHQHIYLYSGEVDFVYPGGDQHTLAADQACLPLAHQQPRPCRCVAKTDCSVLRMDSDRVDRTLSWSQISDYLLSELSMVPDYDEDIEWMQTVLNSNLFVKAPPIHSEHIFSRITPMVVEAGEIIIRQGDIGDCCYFIKEGSAVVSVQKSRSKQSEIVAEIGPGRCFGEDALVNETIRNATVTMTSNGVLMRLEKSDFLLLLKQPLVDTIKREDIGQMMEAPILIDVRTEDEYLTGHLPNSANIPLALLSIKKRLLAPELPYIFYCETGRRSYAAAWLLGKQGYNVLALEGGTNEAGLTEDLVSKEICLLREGELVFGQ